MNKKEWSQYDVLYKKYEKARNAYEFAQMNLRGTFSEMARSYDKASLDHNHLYEEDLAHEKFKQVREALHLFIQDKMKND